MTRTKTRKRLLRVAIALGMLSVFALPFLYSAIVVPLSPWEQAQVALALLGLAMIASASRRLRPLIVFLSCFASMRYLYWRVTSTLTVDGVANTAVSAALLAAEVYGLLIMFLGYFQTIELESRIPPPLGRLPTVDVFIPTYNESVDIVRRTVIGALSMDYPRKQVFVLDDGRRPTIEQMARDLGCFYLTRPDNSHAKAGNLNHALARTHGDLVAIFDADHVPVRSFLRNTVGFFEDARIGLVQSAQHFFNPDPYERNLKLTGRIAPEQDFFYQVVQAGNDFWNSAFFCGSCAVLRRSALQAIGGVRTVTVTEDAHTALELHSRGWRSAYLATPMAAGLATETFAAHVQQRMRWARGMAQILRLDNPLLKRGLSLPQRLNYFNAMAHFFFGIPRLIMVLAPLTYLLFGIHPLRADVPAVLAYILPHIGLSTLAGSLISERFRHSFWAGVYEISIAPFTAGVTLLALVNPRLGKFNVTEKGTNLEKAHFDYSTSWGTLILLGLSVLALMAGLPLRLVFFNASITPVTELHAILINSIWALGNVFMLVAAACVAYEQPQQRRSPRVARDFICELASGETRAAARTLDISESGVRLAFEQPGVLPDDCQLTLGSEQGPLRVRARRRWCDGRTSGGMEAGYEFAGLDAAGHRRLVEMIFTGERSWLSPTHPRDDPFRSLAYLVATPWRVTQRRQRARRQAPRVARPWRCALEGQEGVCVLASPFGGLIELPQPFPGKEGTQVKLDFGGEVGPVAEVRGRVVRREGLRRVAIAFEWDDTPAMGAFSQVLYARESKAAQTSAPHGFGRGAEIRPL
jgi:cellulose synthase (UDP-forming)